MAAFLFDGGILGFRSSKLCGGILGFAFFFELRGGIVGCRICELCGGILVFLLIIAVGAFLVFAVGAFPVWNSNSRWF